MPAAGTGLPASLAECDGLATMLRDLFAFFERHGIRGGFPGEPRPALVLERLLATALRGCHYEPRTHAWSIDFSNSGGIFPAGECFFWYGFGGKAGGSGQSVLLDCPPEPRPPDSCNCGSPRPGIPLS